VGEASRLPCKVAGSLKLLSDVEVSETAEANGRAQRRERSAAVKEDGLSMRAGRAV
jgi:hypothetical protein